MNNLKKDIHYNIWKILRKSIPKTFIYKVSHYKSHTIYGNHRYWANIDQPMTFNEKILWLKTFYRSEIGRLVADKVLVREYVKNKIGDDILIPVIDIFENSSDIRFNELPENFVLKPNHGSGWIIISKGKKSAEEIDEYKRKLNWWMSRDTYYLLGEWQYKNINRKIICEPFVQEMEHLIDYKFFCFNGEPKLVQLDVDRHTGHTRLFKDMEWNDTDITLKYPASDKPVPKPQHFDEMAEIARILSKEFIFARVDLYNNNGKIFFGEITLHPEAGHGPFKNYQQDLIIGEMLNLTVKRGEED